MTAANTACVFCGTRDQSPDTAHIVPESLGGPASPVGAAGVCCRQCNAYFGQKVESVALKSFPFAAFRVFSGIPTKKGNAPRTTSHLGFVAGSPLKGCIGLNPANETISDALASGQIKKLWIPAEVTEPLAVNRLLLKIGVEFLAKHFYKVAVSGRVQAAIEFARRPRRGGRWWSILRTDPNEIVWCRERAESAVEIREINGLLFSILELPGVTAIAPLERGCEPPGEEEIPPPEFRIVRSEL